MIPKQFSSHADTHHLSLFVGLGILQGMSDVQSVNDQVERRSFTDERFEAFELLLTRSQENIFSDQYHFHEFLFQKFEFVISQRFDFEALLTVWAEVPVRKKAVQSRFSRRGYSTKTNLFTIFTLLFEYRISFSSFSNSLTTFADTNSIFSARNSNIISIARPTSFCRRQWFQYEVNMRQGGE